MNKFLQDAYHNTPVLVTGGAGFIGSHLTEALVRLNARVTVLDNLSTGSLKNLATVQDKINFIKGDITDIELCKIATQGVHKIFHLAAIASVPVCQEQPGFCFESNVSGTSNLLESARIHKINTFVFSSSSAVYGSSETPCHEAQATAPSSAYGYSKLMGEQLLEQYQQLYKLEAVSLRYFNVYGERQGRDAVVPAFKWHMEQGLPIKLQGNGLQRRDFVPVSKIVEANLLAGAASTASGPYNIATGASITLLDLIEQLKREYPQYQQPIEFLPARPGDILYSAANCEKYRNFSAILGENS